MVGGPIYPVQTPQLHAKRDTTPRSRYGDIGVYTYVGHTSTRSGCWGGSSGAPCPWAEHAEVRKGMFLTASEAEGKPHYTT